jgi:hypothetical protein
MADLTRAPGEALIGSTISSSSNTGWGRFAPGTLFAGRFRIVAPLGRGGMGEVYRADDLKLGQTVALKFLPADLMRAWRSSTTRSASRRRSRTATSAAPYDISDADGLRLLTMEYVDARICRRCCGGSAAFRRRRPSRLRGRSAPALPPPHERSVLHRDLKPANVMIDGEGTSASPTSVWRWSPRRGQTRRPGVTPVSAPAHRRTWRRSNSRAAR